MFGKIFGLVDSEFSGKRAFDHVARISNFHRVQASPGIRAAAEYAAEQFSKSGIYGEVLGYRTDGDRMFLTYQPWREWAIENAALWLVEPADEARKLADFDDHPISVIQWSVSTPSEGITTEVVIVDNATDEKSYRDKDVRGKFVLVGDGDTDEIKRLAVDRFGAAGIISDYMMEIPGLRQRMDIPDAMHYTAFRASKNDNNCCGFVLSPKAGEMLRRTIKKAGAAGQPVRVKAVVDASYKDGFVNDAVALIGGETHEEVLVYGHLCHPGPSANDNASGSAVVIETARTLNTLIAQGKLKKPKRGIRFLLGAEFTGSYAFVAGNPDVVQRTVAALNLDMVGQDEALCGSFLNVEYPPRAIPSYTGDLMSAVLDKLVSRDIPFRHASVPFSGGSDHLLFSDPTIGIPCPMLICHPDKFYHTSADTLDKVSPTTLKRIGVMAATYLYFIANAGPVEAAWLAHEVSARFAIEAATYCEGEVTRIAEQGKAPAHELAFAQNRLDYLAERKILDMYSVLRLAGDNCSLTESLDKVADGIRATAQAQKQRLCSAVGLLVGAVSYLRPLGQLQSEIKAPSIVARKVHPGPINAEAFVKKAGDQAVNEYRALMTRMPRGGGANYPLHIGFWMDGKRNLHEIMDLVQYETGRYEPDWAVDYVEFLSRLGLVEIAK